MKFRLSITAAALALTSVSEVQAYGEKMCRTFTDDQLPQNFDMTKFYGNWFPMWTSKDSPFIYGLCPIMYLNKYTTDIKLR